MPPNRAQDEAQPIRDRLALSMTEQRLQSNVVALAKLLGYDYAYHTHDSRRSEAGFPDLILLNPTTGRRLVIECKTENGRLSPAQRRWIDAFWACHVEAYVIRPHHWLDGYLESILRDGEAAA